MNDRWKVAAAMLAVLCLLGQARAQAPPGEEIPPDGQLGELTHDIVFVSRKFPSSVSDVRIRASEQGVVVRATYGKLLVRSSDGEIRTLVDGADSESTILDVSDPDVSWDAQSIVFAGYSKADQAWRIFEIGADGQNLRQVTRSDRELDVEALGQAAEALNFEHYDDLDPCHMPDGRICFVSSRYPGRAPDGRGRATNLYVVNSDGTDTHRITTERFGGDTPAIDPTSGEIVYSRWWRSNQALSVDENEDGIPDDIPPGSPGYGGGSTDGSGFSFVDEAPLRGVTEEEFPGVNSWFLSSIRPDGTGLTMFSSFKLDRELTQAYRPAFLASGQAVALFIPQTPHIGLPGLNGIRLYESGAQRPEFVDGPQTFADILPVVDPDFFGNEREPIIDENGEIVPLPPGRRGLSFNFSYASAEPLQNGVILASAAAGPEFDNYDIVLVPASNRGAHTILNWADTAELDAVVLAPREVPPVIEDENDIRMTESVPQSVEEAFEMGGSFEFVVENIFFNADVDVAIPNAPPVGQGLAIEFYMAPQGTTTDVEDPILVARREIPADGRVKVDLPAGVPLFEVLKRPDGEIARGRDGQIFHVAGMNFGLRNEDGKCVGCHMGHSRMEVPEDVSFTNLAGSANVTSDSQAFFPPFAVDPAVDEEFPPELRDIFKGFFSPQNVVDRSTEMFSIWGSNVDQPESHLDFRWTQPIEAREAVVWAPRFEVIDFLGGHEPMLERFELSTSLNGVENQSVIVRELLAPETKISVELDPSISFDKLTITTREQDSIGAPEFGVGAVISEVEVIARVGAADPRPELTIHRGDSNCDSTVNLTDAITTLSFLFVGGFEPCCQAAADANDDDALNLSDPIAVLNRLFLGTGALPFPSEGCGDVPMGRLACEQPSCF